MKDQNGGASDTLREFLSDMEASRLRCFTPIAVSAF